MPKSSTVASKTRTAFLKFSDMTFFLRYPENENSIYFTSVEQIDDRCGGSHAECSSRYLGGLY
jgi:hypothetical protein